MRWTIKKKLMLSNLSVLLILTVVGVFCVLNIFDIRDRYSVLLDERMEKLILIEEIKGAQKESTSSLFNHLLTSTDVSKSEVEESAELTKNLTAELKKGISDPTINESLDEFEKNLNVFVSINQEIIAAKAAENQATIDKLTLNSQAIDETMNGILDNVEQSIREDILKARASVNLLEKNGGRFFTALTLIGVVLGLVLAYLMTQNITKPILKITDGLKEIASGNLTVPSIIVKNKDESGEMATAFNQMTEDLRSIVTNVKDSSIQLAANAEELSAGAEQSLASSQLVARAAGEQVASTDSQVNHMDESMHAMEELTSGINEIYTSNENMLQSTEEVHDLVGTGSNVVASVASHMNTIHTSIHEAAEIVKDMAKHSNEIQSITALITEISEQTNLLSLNAAIEAARAGEHGKGFAVVAEEVRKLAEQSKTSATEIDRMIAVIQAASNKAVNAIAVGEEKVEEGITKTDESLEVFNQIETAVLGVNEKVHSVSNAVHQIQEIAAMVSEGSKEVQRLAAIVADGANDTSAATEEQLAVNEEITANAQSLANLAENLQNIISHFKI